MMNDISIVLCGKAGQGIQTVEYLLTKIMKLSGYNIFSTKEFMSRIRGGSNSTEIRISENNVSSYLKKMDILIPLSEEAIPHVKKRITADTIIIGEKEYLKYDSENKIEFPFTDIAQEIGNRIYANTIAVGMLSGILRANKKITFQSVKKYFFDKDKKIISDNVNAARLGYKKGVEISNKKNLHFKLNKSKKVREKLLLSGTEAVSLGAIAGNCDFISSYPMSPSTGVLTFLAEQAEDFGIIVEQAEDEISAINMAIGAWYAGGRGMVTTSGGGFALMAEGLSLSGMLETPIVIHLAQRPGPATGLPTRTEQGDLLFTLFAGHGEFPRIILTPGKPEDAFYLTQKAFNLADKFQIPVIIMTDQYFLDSRYTVTSFGLDKIKNRKYLIKTKKGYKRYRITEDGISPRGIPGFGRGLVSVDSDEHDEDGHITENLELRKEMVDKRLKKINFIKKESVPPEIIGSKNYDTLIVGWGTTYHPIREVLNKIKYNNVSFIHYKQTYPLHDDTEKYLKKADRLIIVENNATAQFSQLIKLTTGITIKNRILKYSGITFSIEELENALNEILSDEV